jgi:F-type H+-transporting ATPase subunit gamma
MSRRRALETHRRTLGEIRGIMNSMKTLAYMEGRKLAPFLKAQQAVVAGIESVVADFLGFHREALPALQQVTPVYLVIGSEQGFCGDFNETLLGHLASALETTPGPAPLLVAVGRKLHPLLAKDPRIADLLDGATVAEEMETVLTGIVDTLTTLQAKHAMIRLYVLHHGREEVGIVARQLLPPFQGLAPGPFYPHAPLLNLTPRALLLELTEHYLYAALHEILYTSLMAESTVRVRHLDGAVRHLDEQSARLLRRSNALRQEEIIEEIEVILLSAASLDQAGLPQGPQRCQRTCRASNGTQASE